MAHPLTMVLDSALGQPQEAGDLPNIPAAGEKAGDQTLLGGKRCRHRNFPRQRRCDLIDDMPQYRYPFRCSTAPVGGEGVQQGL